MAAFLFPYIWNKVMFGNGLVQVDYGVLAEQVKDLFFLRNLFCSAVSSP